jgi:hypothetical protein
MPEMFCYSITSLFSGGREGLFRDGSGLRQFGDEEGNACGTGDIQGT